MDEIWTTHDLRHRGLTERQVAGLVRSGKLIRIQRGWYASRRADARVVAAMRAGARLGCLSGAELHGLWVPPQQGHEPHVIRPTNWHPRVTTGVIAHPGRVDHRRALSPVEDCLAHIATHHDPETALIVLESAATIRAVAHSTLLRIIREAPVGSARTLRHFSLRAESGTETRLRLWCQRRRIPVRAQVWIAGIGRVDLLVGERLIIEADSRRHHTDVPQYHQDRRRDLEAARLGYQVIRLTWEQVFLEWDETQRDLSTVMARRQHHRPPHPGAPRSHPQAHPAWWLAS